MIFVFLSNLAKKFGVQSGAIGRIKTYLGSYNG